MATSAVRIGGYIGKPSYLDTLAAAYAETGDFDSAVKYEQKAISAQTNNDKLDDNANARLELYGQHRPYRDNVR